MITEEIRNIRRNEEYLNCLSDDLLFGIVCYKYFYNEGRFDLADYKASYTDGANDGGIDLIAVKDDEMSKSLVLVQSRNVSGLQSKDEVKDIFTKMAQTVSDFKKEKIGSYNEKLRRIFREKYDDAVDDPNFSIELTLFLGLNKDEDTRCKILEHLAKVEVLEDYQVSIYYKNEIEQQIQLLNDGQRFVPNGQLKIFKEDGVLKNQDNGILVNASALSLRKMFDLYKDKGLFEQNFRYFVKHQKIDSQINGSLKSNRGKFWFLNNGIIIGCKDFRRDGDNIKLEQFSIINGCQTTTLLGKYKGANNDIDFSIPCKIVKPEKPNDQDYFNLFITQIAQASNSQKPISDRDLKSNQPELRKLQKVMMAEEPKVYIEIKRGEGILRNRTQEKWQKVKNEYLGQLVLSFILQKPGTARSGKRKIFSDKSIYNSVFKRTYDKATTVDILKLSEYYDHYVLSAKLNDASQNVASNGKFAILGIIGYLIKYRRGMISPSNDTTTHEGVQDITVDDIKDNLFDPNRPDDFLKPLYSLFNKIVLTLSSLYTSRGDLETSVTNFFKTDRKYYLVILDRIKSELILDDYEYKSIKDKMDLVFM